MAAKFGVTTESISEMQYIADQSSTSIEGMTSAMSMLLNRAKEDSEVFRRLGISVQDANGNFKAMDELFYDTIGALNDVEDANERNALMLETFGRSAFSVGEVVRKSSEELAQMRQEAHNLGVVMNEETVQYASDFNDTLAVLKLQGQSALASLVAGAPDAEERLQAFFDRVLEFAESAIPAFTKFGIKLLVNVTVALIRMIPSLVTELTTAFIDALFSINWLEVGADIVLSIIQGSINTITGSWLGKALGWEKVDLGISKKIFDFSPDEPKYSINQNTTTTNKNEIVVKVEAEGNTQVSEESAKKTAEALAPYINEILGGM